jgi:hypothetical protein
VQRWMIGITIGCLILGWLRVDRAKVWGDRKTYRVLSFYPAFGPTEIQFNRIIYSDGTVQYHAGFHYTPGKS